VLASAPTWRAVSREETSSSMTASWVARASASRRALAFVSVAWKLRASPAS
jgi:hypothetical protein